MTALSGDFEDSEQKTRSRSFGKKWSTMVVKHLKYWESNTQNLKRVFIPVEKHKWYYLFHSRQDQWVHFFPQSISSKMNITARMEFELAYFEAMSHTLLSTPLFKTQVYTSVINLMTDLNRYTHRHKHTLSHK